VPYRRSFEMKQEQKDLQVILSGEAHFFFKCDKLESFKKMYQLSERKLSSEFNISKSQIHRMLAIAKTDIDLRIAVLNHNVDFHALAVFHESPVAIKEEFRKKILSGQIIKHKQAQGFIGIRQSKLM
jgi:hypothetical protein